MLPLERRRTGVEEQRGCRGFGPEGEFQRGGGRGWGALYDGWTSEEERQEKEGLGFKRKMTQSAAVMYWCVFSGGKGNMWGSHNQKKRGGGGCV